MVDHSEVEIIFVTHRCLALVHDALGHIAASGLPSRVKRVVVMDGDTISGTRATGESEHKGGDADPSELFMSSPSVAEHPKAHAAWTALGDAGVEVSFLVDFATCEGDLDDPLTLPRGGGEQLFSLLYTSG